MTKPAAGDRSRATLVEGAQARQAIIVGVACYLLWGATPILFMALGRAGADAWEIVGQRAMWSAPWALLLVFIMGQGPELWRILRSLARSDWWRCPPPRSRPAGWCSSGRSTTAAILNRVSAIISIR